MTDNTFGMTEVGKQRYDLLAKYHLEDFYDVENGTVIILNHEFEEPISRYILMFVKDNPEWVLGHERNYWYLTTKTDIKET